VIYCYIIIMNVTIHSCVYVCESIIRSLCLHLYLLLSSIHDYLLTFKIELMQTNLFYIEWLTKFRIEDLVVHSPNL